MKTGILAVHKYHYYDGKKKELFLFSQIHRNGVGSRRLLPHPHTLVSSFYKIPLP